MVVHTQLDKLVPENYERLREIASHLLFRRRFPASQRTTSIVHEAYIRLARDGETRVRGREHFLALAARAMRLLLVDQVRRRTSLKAGGGEVPRPIDALGCHPTVSDVDLLGIDDALASLASRDERQARVVELRFFGGLSVEETAEVLGVSAPTVKRDWALAKDWLRHELSAA